MLDERQKHALDPRRKHSTLPGWGVKVIHRLEQVTGKPGIYPMTLVVGQDGRRQLVVEGGKLENLGE